jgi:hypothetical protein
MKTVIYAFAAAITLAGCATGPTSYGPAQNGGLGFGSQQIEKDRFQISFTGKSVDEARQYALLRAAELTLANGYDHFKVIGSDTYGQNGQRSPVSSSIGVGVGSGGGYRRGTRTNVGLGIGIADLGQALSGDKVTASMEIITQNGNTSSDPNIYDAQSIVNSIKPAVYTP